MDFFASEHSILRKYPTIDYSALTYTHSLSPQYLLITRDSISREAKSHTHKHTLSWMMMMFPSCFHDRDAIIHVCLHTRRQKETCVVLASCCCCCSCLQSLRDDHKDV